MSYIDGFVIPVAKSDKGRFIEFANYFDKKFVELGALRVLECWADDVPTGKETDFYRAVKTEDSETVVFSWIEWPDKETRDYAMAEMTKLMETDPEWDPNNNPMPFDGKRLIYGGFLPVVKIEK